MIAQVYPFVRLPRRFGFFDYRIPENMQVQVGDIVRIRFRGRPMLGVVRKLTSKSEFPKLFPLESVLFPAFMTKDDVQRVEAIANAIIQSPATVFYVTYGFLKGRSSAVQEVPAPTASVSVSQPVARTVEHAMQQHEKSPLFIQTSMEGSFALAHTLRKQVKDQMLIIAPRGRVAIDLSQSVPLGPRVGFLTGQTPATAREATAKAWASGEINTLIATRLGARLAAKRLSTILLLESSSDDYINLERNPRIDARLAAEQLAHQHNARLIHTGPVPDLMSLHKERTIIWDDLQPPTVVNLKALQERTETPLLTQTVKKRIEETLQNKKNVLVSFNRRRSKKGAALPTNTELAQLFALAFPSFRVGVYDKLHKETGSILIVTEAYFKNTLPPFRAKQFGCIVELDFDLSFSGTDYRAKENAAYKLYRLLHIGRQQQADVFIQTWMPEAVNELLHTASYLEKEYTTRKQYQLPPYTPRAEITDQNGKEEIIFLSEKERQELKNLPDNSIIVITTDTYESPNGSDTSE